MKKLISILTVSAIAASLAVPAFAADASGYTLNINGKASDASVCVMVPLRSVAEQLGFKVVWNNGSVLVDDGRCTPPSPSAGTTISSPRASRA
jgi:hypothetical protein